MIRIAYINLRSRSERNAAFLGHNRAELDAAGFPWRRADGIDGSQLANSPVEQLAARGIISRHGLDHGYQPHTWGHLGCALAHRALWEGAAHSADGDVLVILEDDGQVCPQFGVRLRRVLELATHRDPWDIVHLGFNTDAPLTIELDSPRMEIELTCRDKGRPVEPGAPFAVSWPGKSPENEMLLARAVDIHGLCGYAVSTHGARRLLAACFPMTATSIDGTVSRQTRDGLLRALIVIPPLVLSPNDHADSDTVASSSSPYNELVNDEG